LIENFFPSRYNKQLRWLGRREWVSFDTNPQGVEIAVNAESLIPTQKEVEEFGHQTIRDAIESTKRLAPTGVDKTFLYIAAKSLASGHKLFQPDLDHCLAIENTEINISIADYEQPFPVLIIELPKLYRDLLERRYSTEAPKYVISFKETNIVCAIAWFNPDNVIVNSLTNRPEYKTIEHAFKLTRPEKQFRETDFEVAELVQRLAYNFSLLMTVYGVRINLSNNEAIRKQQKLARSKNARKAERAKRLLDEKVAVYLCEFEQNIKLYDTDKSEASKEYGDSRESPAPHWRRGHFKMQPYGPKAELRKKIFIKPILVMASNFAGDLADTAVTYRLGNE